MTVIFGESLIKAMKGWELSDESNELVTKYFRGATTNDMKSYVQPSV